ncbi:MAG: hypothetical protein WBL06_04635 [Pseudolysinimonas sp.]|uniref:hypothetical protein n=1 Tax=Pseudolysinimonas sp. TaxID=2680009 RepID=UPI003C7351C4
MESLPAGRGLEIATAIALGIVSVVTALGVLQASVWNSDAGRFATDSADARDQSISVAVVAQLKQRADLGAMYEAERLARLQDEALAAGDELEVLELDSDISGALATVYVDGASELFAEWRSAGFPADGNPAASADYLVQNQGEADALTLASQRLGDLGKQLAGRAAIFGQASLVHALALFLFGVAGINRLRTTRYITLAMGGSVFLFGLLLMSTAY